MSRKTKIEEATHRGEIRLQIDEVRSNLIPPWWEFKHRFRWWRLSQRVKTDRQKFSIETQIALAWAEEALEEEFLFGKKEKG